jgi:RNA polymerase sigma-70 factor, ECF subfamily
VERTFFPQHILPSREQARRFIAVTSARLNINTNAGAEAQVDPAQAGLASIPMTDEQLVRQIAAGDASALEELYDRYARQCFSLTQRMLGDPNMAEQAVQEVFLKLWARPDSYPASYLAQEGWFLSWLLSVTHNKCVAELRLLRLRHPEGDLEAMDDPVRGDLLDILVDAALGAADQILLRERQPALQQALRQLAPGRRQVLELAYFEGLSQADIAARLGQPLGTVKSHTRTALQELQALFGLSS